MQIVTSEPPRNAAQITLLQIYNKYNIKEEEKNEIRTLIANYFFEKTLAKIDALWESNVVNEDSIGQLIMGE